MAVVPWDVLDVLDESRRLSELHGVRMTRIFVAQEDADAYMSSFAVFTPPRGRDIGSHPCFAHAFSLDWFIDSAVKTGDFRIER